MVSCGAVVSEDPVNGVKCAHVTKQTDKYPGLQTICQSLEYINPNTSETVKTGNLITINTITENNLVKDHYLAVTQDTGLTGIF